MTWQEVCKEEAQRDEVEDWELVLIVVATAVESAFFFNVFLAPFWGEGFREAEGNKRNKQIKTNFPNNSSSLFVFPFLFLYFHSLSLSLSLFLSFYFILFLSLSCWAKKFTKITETIENHQKYQKSPIITEITENTPKPYKKRVPKITFAKITKHYENRGEKSLERNTPGENRALTDANRRHFGVDGRFSAVNRRECRRLAAMKGPGNFTPKIFLEKQSQSFVPVMLSPIKNLGGTWCW